MTLQQLLRLAWRIFRGRATRFLSITHGVALGSVALSSAALLLTLAVLNGFEQTLQEKVALFVSHVDVRFLSPVAQQSSERWRQHLARLNPSICLASTYVELEALLSHRGNVEAALLHADVPAVRSRYQALNIPELSAGMSCALGRPLAERLGVRRGDTVVVIASSGSSGALSTPVIGRIRVDAIYESGMRQFDESIVLVTPSVLHRLQHALLPTGISLWLDDARKSQWVARQIDSLFGAALYARSYRDIHPAMFTWIAMQKRPIPIIVGILSVVAAFNILTLLFVALVERRSTLATLRMLGLQRKHLLTMVVGYGLAVAIAGYAIGVAIATGFASAQRTMGLVRLDATVYFIDRLPVEFLWWHFAAVGAAVALLTLGVLVLPVLAAMRISPLAIIRIR
jgi:lipoprotein-releasing system permease protein